MLDFGKVEFVHVPRERNQEADAEANKAMDLVMKQPGLL